LAFERLGRSLNWQSVAWGRDCADPDSGSLKRIVWYLGVPVEGAINNETNHPGLFHAA
jgi:hypothetical protein